MKLFSQDGHLTSEGLEALVREELDETARMEAAEHLDFCDLCVERYADLLTEAVEIAPPPELSLTVMVRLRKRLRMVFFNRFTRVSVAAAMAIVIWMGSFSTEGLLSRSTSLIASYSENEAAISQAISDLGEGMDNFFTTVKFWFRSGQRQKASE